MASDKPRHDLSRDAADGAGGEPRYRRLSALLEEEIRAGGVRPGARLASERELAQRHGVSLTTVRQALELLAASGLVERRHGSGTFVRDPAVRPARSALVGVMVPSLSSFFGEIVHGIEDELRAAGHRPVLYNSGYDSAIERQHLRALEAHQLDALLLAPTLHSGDPASYMEELRAVRRKLPVVFVERRLPDDDTEFVSSDPVAGGALAVEHLVGLGRRRIAFIGPTRTAPAEFIYAGYVKGLARAGMSEDPMLVRRDYEWGRRGAADEADVERLMALAAGRRPDGILCMGDQYAFRVYYTLRRLGFRVPEDVSLVAYDDVVAHLLEVPLTAVAPPKYEVGRQAAALLVRRLREGSRAPIQQVLLKPRLVIRGTCGGVAEESVEPALAAIHE